MFKTWTASAADAGTLARGLEAHLNEYADEVISVAYAVSTGHHVLAVYRPVEAAGDASEQSAVLVAEQIIDQVG